MENFKAGNSLLDYFDSFEKESKGRRQEQTAKKEQKNTKELPNTTPAIKINRSSFSEKEKPKPTKTNLKEQHNRQPVNEEDIFLNEIISDLKINVISEKYIEKEEKKQKTSSKIDEILAQSRKETPEKITVLKNNEQYFNDKPQFSTESKDKDMPTLVEEKPKFSMLELLEQTETCYKDEWIEMFEKGQKSKKNNEVAKKIKNGRFRINSNHSVEILPDIRTDNKTSEELLSRKWI